MLLLRVQGKQTLVECKLKLQSKLRPQIHDIVRAATCNQPFRSGRKCSENVLSASDRFILFTLSCVRGFESHLRCRCHCLSALCWSLVHGRRGMSVDWLKRFQMSRACRSLHGRRHSRRPRRTGRRSQVSCHSFACPSKVFRQGISNNFQETKKSMTTPCPKFRNRKGSCESERRRVHFLVLGLTPASVPDLGSSR